MDFAIALNPGGVGFNDRDLSEYQARGGKVIAYHGRIDETVTSELAMDYFKGVQASLNFTVEEMHDFYRLFYVPGHQHCEGGPGAWNMGQTYPMDPNRLDPTHNALLALAEWVEKGHTPEEIIGTKHEDDDVEKEILAQRSMAPSEHIDRRHCSGTNYSIEHCAYPYRGKWDGKGDSNKASSWSCEMALE